MGGLNLNRGNPGKPQEGASAGPQSSVDTGERDSQGQPIIRTTIEDPTPKLKTAEEAGITDDQLDKDFNSEKNAVPRILAHESAGNAGVTEDTDGKVFSSHPVQNFKIGRFKFDKATLVLRGKDEVDEFETLLKGIPAPNRVLIKEIDTKLAGQIASAHAGARATKSFDSSVGRRALENLSRDSRTIGEDDLDAATRKGPETFGEQGGHNENLPLDSQIANLAGAAGAKAEGEGEQGNQS